MYRLFFFMACFFIYTSSVLAEYSIATVDINRVLNESKESVAAKKELDQASAKAKTKVEERRNSLKAIEAKIKAGKISPDSQEAENFRADAKDFTRYVKDTEEKLRRDFMKSNKHLTEKTLAAISKYAESNNIDIVLDKSAEGGRGPVLFGMKSFDITENIIKKVNS
ncbi:MAG: OmpH family outer membrane protein [Bdellovibrionales bacterium]|nr:OmpH family outer membrane protein [Bdellovibrionales bacterium]